MALFQPPRRPSSWTQVRPAGSPFAPVSVRPPVTRSFGAPVNPGEAALFDMAPAEYTMDLSGSVPNDPSQLGLNALSNGEFTMDMTGSAPNDPSQLGLNALPQATTNFDGSPIPTRHRMDSPAGWVSPLVRAAIEAGGYGPLSQRPKGPGDYLAHLPALDQAHAGVVQRLRQQFQLHNQVERQEPHGDHTYQPGRDLGFHPITPPRDNSPFLRMRQELLGNTRSRNFSNLDALRRRFMQQRVGSTGRSFQAV